MQNEGQIFPIANLSEVDPRCADLDYITQAPRAIDAQYMMSNNFAFGGINTSLIFRRQKDIT
jgi:3-oxoacyl-[acyl-carrier-protein] synthase II